MRSEKVYHLRKLIEEKLKQLEQEKHFIKEQYKEQDMNNDRVKEEVRYMYKDLKDEKEQVDQELQDKIKEILMLGLRERALKK